MPVRPRVAMGIIPSLSTDGILGRSVALAAPNARLLYNLKNAEFWGAADGLCYQEASSPTNPTVFGTVASLFTAASSQALSVASAPLLSVGGDDFTVAGWWNPTGGSMDLFAKWNPTGNQREYSAYLDVNRLPHFSISDDGAATSATLDGTVALAANEWNFVVIWRDTAAGKFYVQVNLNATIDELSSSATVFSGTAAFELGYNRSSGFFNGGAALVGFWNGRSLSEAERVFLYNGGSGRGFADFPDTLRASLISFWALDEPSSTRYDLIGSYNLTASASSPTSTLGPATTATARVGTLKNMAVGSTFTTLVNTTEANRPVKVRDAKGCGALFFDGVNDTLV